MIHSKEEITAAIENNFSSLVSFVEQQNEKEFIAMPEGKWSSGQHLQHLIKTTRPVLMAFNTPTFILRWVFGKPNRKERTYDELVEKYKSKLANGAVAPRVFVPGLVAFERKQEIISRFLSLKEKLKSRIDLLPGDKLSRYLLPHPLLGKLTLREMLFFTIYHTEHHSAILKKR